jgi:hypothetical protein
MNDTLQVFAAECHKIIKLDSGRRGIEAVREKLEPLLLDEEFIATYLGADNHSARKIIYEDSELGFCILAHVFKGYNEAPPHDHGPSWAIYGQAAGKTEMTEYDEVGSHSDGEIGIAKPVKSYTLEPGMAVAYQVGDLHSPQRDGETRLIRMEGQNLEGIKRDKFQRA